MASIRTRVISPIRLDVPRFTRTEMRSITEGVKTGEVDRIKSALKPDLTAAKALKPGYQKQKNRKGGRSRRDWTLTGDMLRGLRVTVSDAARGIIKFSSDQIKKAMIREHADELFNLSPRGEKFGAEIAKRHWDKAVKRTARGAK